MQMHSIVVNKQVITMGAFTTKKTLYGNASQIPSVAEQIRQAFAADGYEVRIDNPATGQEIKLDEKAVAIAERALYQTRTI